MTTDTDRAEGQAKAQLESIVSMIERRDHIRLGCDIEDCDLDHATILEGIDIFPSAGQIPTAEEIEQYHDEDQAMRAIEEDVLSVQVRSGWHAPGDTLEAAEYEILLCTGGPAARIVGDLDEYGYPDSARLEYQDWFTPWTKYICTGSDHDALMSYAQSQYYGS